MATEEATQLAFPVKISLSSQVSAAVARSFRSFRYSAPIQILQIIWFWAHCGALIAFCWFLNQHQSILSSSTGIFPGNQVHSLQIIWDYYFASIALLVTVYVASMMMIKFGKIGIVPYLFALALLFQVAIIRVCVTPILLLIQ